ncbi:MAG: hypothetical protein LBF43_03865 [Puniceicoccales bacterium]|jgi:hypothetical protein|nr:hypothetical protein [Puniceicoccales bacterium]
MIANLHFRRIRLKFNPTLQKKQQGSLILSVMLLSTLGALVFIYTHKQNSLYRQWKFRIRTLQAEKLALWTCHHALKKLSKRATVDTLATYDDENSSLPIVQFYDTLNGNRLKPIVSKGESSIRVNIDKSKHHPLTLPLEQKTNNIAVAYGVIEGNLLKNYTNKIPICNAKQGGLRELFGEAIHKSPPKNFPGPEALWNKNRQRFLNLEDIHQPLSTMNGFLPVLLRSNLTLTEQEITVKNLWWNPYDRALEGTMDFRITLVINSESGHASIHRTCNQTIHIKPGDVRRNDITYPTTELQDKKNIFLNNLQIQTGTSHHSCTYHMDHIPCDCLPKTLIISLNIDAHCDFHAINLWPSHNEIPTTAPSGKRPGWKKSKPSAPRVQSTSLWVSDETKDFSFLSKQTPYLTQTPFQRMQACFLKEEQIPYACIGWPNSAKTHRIRAYNQFFWDYFYCDHVMPLLNVNTVSDDWAMHFENVFKSLGCAHNTADLEHFIKKLQGQVIKNRPFLSVEQFIQSGILQTTLDEIDAFKKVRQSDVLSYLKNPLAVRSECFVIIGTAVVKHDGETVQKTCKMLVHREASDATKRLWVVDGITWL